MLKRTGKSDENRNIEQAIFHCWLVYRIFICISCMQILFFATAMWSGSSNYEFYKDNQEHIRFAMRLQLSLGWIMCIIAGLGFSILPLLYDLHSFEKSVMRTYLGLNISGQFAIMLGVVSGIMTGDLLIFETLATTGITLLCASLANC